MCGSRDAIEMPLKEFQECKNPKCVYCVSNIISIAGNKIPLAQPATPVLCKIEELRNGA